MITRIFPQGSQRFVSLPVLGPLMDRYAGWLYEQQYTWRSTRYELRMAARVADYLKRRAVRQIEDLSEQHLEACHRWFLRKFPEEAGGVLALARFLRENGHIEKSSPLPPPGRAEIHVNAFMAHLAEVRGYAPSTIRRQGQIAAEFLTWLHFADAPDRLSSLTPNDLEGFIRHLSKRMSRGGCKNPLPACGTFSAFWLLTGLFLPAWTTRLTDHGSIARSNSRVRCHGQPSKRFSGPSIAIRRSGSAITECSR